MKAVFLDAETFNIDTPAPKQVTHWHQYNYTKQDDDEIIKRLAVADIAIVNKVALSDHVIKQLSQLKMIQITATGINNIDSDTCETANIICKNVSDYAKYSVPEHTFALLLSLTRHIHHYHQAVSSGVWTESRQFCLTDKPNIDIRGKTLGLIGYGTTGKRVADIAKAFGMNILIAEHQGKQPRNDDYTVFETVLERADVISLHCPLTKETEKLINTETIAMMQAKPILLNLARGGIVDEASVAKAIEMGQLSGFATDVLAKEPPKEDNPILGLMDRANVVVTPHVAWASEEAQKALWDKVCKQVNEFIEQSKV